MNSTKPKMYIETTETNRNKPKQTETNRKCLLKQSKQRDLFQNQPKQTENVLNILKAPKLRSLSSCRFRNKMKNACKNIKTLKLQSEVLLNK
jgi:hypothetical protein